jgi:hypothetical protein
VNILKTKEQILADIEAKLIALNSPLTDWNVGSIMRTISEVFSDIGEDCYIDLYQYLLQTWIHTSTGEWVDFHGTVWSQTRKAGANYDQCSRGNIYFTSRNDCIHERTNSSAL